PGRVAEHLDRLTGRDETGRLRRGRAGDGDPAGGDDRLCLLPARRQPPAHELRVEPATCGQLRPARGASLLRRGFLGGCLLRRAGLLGGSALGRRGLLRRRRRASTTSARGNPQCRQLVADLLADELAQLLSVAPRAGDELL